MKLQTLLVAPLLSGPVVLAQDQPLPEPSAPVAEAVLERPAAEGRALSDEEQEVLRKLEEIEKDPIVREKALVEAKVPHTTF